MVNILSTFQVLSSYSLWVKVILWFGVKGWRQRKEGLRTKKKMVTGMYWSEVLSHLNFKVWSVETSCHKMLFTVSSEGLGSQLNGVALMAADPPPAKSTTDTDTHIISYYQHHFWLFGPIKEHPDHCHCWLVSMHHIAVH